MQAMTAIKQLQDEHQAVRTMLLVWKKIVVRMEKGGEVGMEDLDNLLAFMKSFVDRCHHQKEESYLFPALMELDIPEITEMVKKLTNEHGKLHLLAQEINSSLDGYKKGDPRAKEKLVGSLKEYIGLLSRHESEETDILFGKANDNLSEETQMRLEKDFKRIELEYIGAGRHEEFYKIIDNLHNHYN